MVKVLAFFIVAIAAMFYFTRPGSLTTDSASASGNTTAGSLQKIAALPGEINESSGVIALAENGHYLTHNDAGNQPHLYRINSKAEITQTIKLKLPNVDWEDLAMDKDGNIYIADTGNNNNRRKELAIYKINLKDTEKPQAIRFTYEDQKEYPPSKKDRNFDCEAIFWHDDNIYLISKDRGQEKTAKVYQLPAEPGTYVAKLIGKHNINTMITGAAISPDEETVALISEGKLHIFTGYTSPASFYEGKYKAINIKEAGQTEGVAFEDDSTLIITSEGGSLYRFGL
ncbi:hypothetical protein ABID22_002124 [Pontibacter aydingkolensis]|nr:hypothetical protein [Pontibacter aydingkolensis]